MPTPRPRYGQPPAPMPASAVDNTPSAAANGAADLLAGLDLDDDAPARPAPTAAPAASLAEDDDDDAALLLGALSARSVDDTHDVNADMPASRPRYGGAPATDAGGVASVGPGVQASPAGEPDDDMGFLLGAHIASGGGVSDGDDGAALDPANSGPGGPNGHAAGDRDDAAPLGGNGALLGAAAAPVDPGDIAARLQAAMLAAGADTSASGLDLAADARVGRSAAGKKRTRRLGKRPSYSHLKPAEDPKKKKKKRSMLPASRPSYRGSAVVQGAVEDVEAVHADDDEDESVYTNLITSLTSELDGTAGGVVVADILDGLTAEEVRAFQRKQSAIEPRIVGASPGAAVADADAGSTQRQLASLGAFADLEADLDVEEPDEGDFELTGGTTFTAESEAAALAKIGAAEEADDGTALAAASMGTMAWVPAGVRAELPEVERVGGRLAGAARRAGEDPLTFDAALLTQRRSSAFDAVSLLEHEFHLGLTLTAGAVFDEWAKGQAATRTVPAEPVHDEVFDILYGRLTSAKP